MKGSDVLDVGCGDAGALIAFAEQGARCAGIECFDTSLERGSLRAADHGVTVDLRKGVAESIPYPDSSFDLVMLDNVLEHVNDRPLTLREVRRVLKPVPVFFFAELGRVAVFGVMTCSLFPLLLMSCLLQCAR